MGDDKIMNVEKELRKFATEIAEKDSSQSAAVLQIQVETREGLSDESSRRRESEERILRTLGADVVALEARLTAAIADGRDVLTRKHDEAAQEARHQRERLVEAELALENLPKEFHREHMEVRRGSETISNDVSSLKAHLSRESQALRGLEATVLAQCVSLEHVDGTVKGLNATLVEGLTKEEIERDKALCARDKEISDLQSSMITREKELRRAQADIQNKDVEAKQRFAEFQVLFDVLEGRVATDEQHLTRLASRTDSIEQIKLDGLEGRVHELATLNSALWTKTEVLDKYNAVKQFECLEQMKITSDEHERALTGWETVLTNPLPSRFSVLERQSTHFERRTQEVEQLKIVVGDLTVHS